MLQTGVAISFVILAKQSLQLEHESGIPRMSFPTMAICSWNTNRESINAKYDKSTLIKLGFKINNQLRNVNYE
jgi:hypothetical protein